MSEPAPAAEPQKKKSRRVVIEGREYTEFEDASGNTRRIPIKQAKAAENTNAAPAGEKKSGPWPAVLAVAGSVVLLGGAAFVVARRFRGGAKAQRPQSPFLRAVQ